MNPRDVALPPPQPPTERLLKAVEEFYNTDTEEEKEGDKKETEGKEGNKEEKEGQKSKEKAVKRNE